MEPQVALEQSGSTRAARVRTDCRAFPQGAGVICPERELTAGPCSAPGPFPAGGVPSLPGGFNLPLCPRLLGTQPPCLDRAQQAHHNLPSYKGTSLRSGPWLAVRVLVVRDGGSARKRSLSRPTLEGTCWLMNHSSAGLLMAGWSFGYGSA